MSSKKIIVASSENKEPVFSGAKAPKVVGAKPAFGKILVEMLTSAELMSTNLVVSDNTNAGVTPQAYILDIGPGMSPEMNLKIGDRIVVQGAYIPLPNYDNSHRQKGIIETHAVKAVLVEG